MQDGQFLLKLTLEMTIYFRQFSTDQDATMTRHDCRPWFICVLNKKSLAQFLHTKLACTCTKHRVKILKSTIFKVFPNRQFSTDPDKTLTRHDFRPQFIRE